MYVLYEDWKDVSKRSRLELLRGTTSQFDRIVHTDGWEDRFENLINSELEKRQGTKGRPKMQVGPYDARYRAL
jgi:hypothetical protein